MERIPVPVRSSEAALATLGRTLMAVSAASGVAMLYVRDTGSVTAPAVLFVLLGLAYVRSAGDVLRLLVGALAWVGILALYPYAARVPEQYRFGVFALSTVPVALYFLMARGDIERLLLADALAGPAAQREFEGSHRAHRGVWLGEYFSSLLMWVVAAFVYQQLPTPHSNATRRPR